MTWTKHKHGDSRIVSKFLFFPKEIDKVVRWLEYATIRQQYVEFIWPHWRDMQWMSEYKQ